MYLRCFTSDRPHCWFQWLPWVEYCYNTSYHSSLKATPFKVVYGRSPPTMLSYCPGAAKLETVDQELFNRDLVLQDLRNRLIQAQNSMKARYDAKHLLFTTKLVIMFYLNYTLTASLAFLPPNTLNSPPVSMALFLL